MSNREAYKNSNWEPGKSGNPNGRPKKGASITECIKNILEREVSTKKGKRKLKEIFSEKVVKLAFDGDKYAMKYVMNYHDGMPVQKQEIKAELENININFGKSDDNKS